MYSVVDFLSSDRTYRILVQRTAVGDEQNEGWLRSRVEAPTCETFVCLRETPHRDSSSILSHLTHFRILAPPFEHVDTDVCETNPLERVRKTSFQSSTTSGAGEQFKLLDCMAKARVKAICFSRTPVLSQPPFPIPDFSFAY